MKDPETYCICLGFSKYNIFTKKTQKPPKQINKNKPTKKPHQNKTTNTIFNVQTEVKLEHRTKTFSVCRTILRVSGASEGNMAREIRKTIDKQSPFSAPKYAPFLVFSELKRPALFGIWMILHGKISLLTYVFYSWPLKSQTAIL